MLAHVTQTVCAVSCSASAKLLSPVCDTSPELTGSLSELLDTAYVTNAKMCTTVSCHSVFCAYSSSTQLLTLTVSFTFVAKPVLPVEVILFLQLLCNRQSEP